MKKTKNTLEAAQKARETYERTINNLQGIEDSIQSFKDKFSSVMGMHFSLLVIYS